MRYDKQQNLITRLWPAQDRPERETALRRIEEALNRIGDQDADIFRDFYVRGLPQRDVAAKYGIGPHLIASRLLKVTARLKKYPAAQALLRGEAPDLDLTPGSPVGSLGLAFASMRSLEAEGVYTVAELALLIRSGRIRKFRRWGKKAVAEASALIRNAGFGGLLDADRCDAEQSVERLFRMLWPDWAPDKEAGLALVEEALSGETLRNAGVFRAYFLSGRPLEEIGREFRVTRERIRQIRDSVLRRMRMNPRMKQEHGSSPAEAKLSRSTKVELLGMGTRAMNACRAAGVETAADLARAIRDRRLSEESGCGKGTLQEMKARLSLIWPQGHDPEFEPAVFSPFAVRRCALTPERALYFVCRDCGQISDVGDMWEFRERAWKRSFPKEWVETAGRVPFRVIALACLTVEENAYLCGMCGTLKTGKAAWMHWKASADLLRRTITSGACLPAIPDVLLVLWAKQESGVYTAWLSGVIDEMLEKGISADEASRNLAPRLKMDPLPPARLAGELLVAVRDEKEKRRFIRFCSEKLAPAVWKEAVRAKPELEKWLSGGRRKTGTPDAEAT